MNSPTHDEQDLDDLRHHWGEAYLIHRLGDRWVAQRRDKSRRAVSADSAAGLLELIRDDYADRPVRGRTMDRGYRNHAGATAPGASASARSRRPSPRCSPST